ncbi:GAF and ANTAR domain-containing protein [Pedococcus bigeumensis]|uniref:ANTAR domain-containing protein n=1 Tax=Pedococcus bigeumensis TaxID=433644 RepID=A0A502CGU0_9MICO|nr:GAF and ANTAR domain-containing protein [Pedococcus bigeumensis]TPG12945.1 ANTAR domain-containing protein [Pedococcus bigeumensis]
MQTPIPREATEAFASLAKLVYAGSASQEVLDAICRTAIEIIPGAHHACISTLDANEQLHTQASTDDIASTMDRLESEAHEGPCLDSIVEDSVQHDADITDDTKWPRLAELTVSRTPVRGMLGYQLMDGLGSRAAFNVFSDTPGALTTESVDVGAVLAAFTSVALAAAERQTSAENLRRGLESNREIGKAIGLLMAAHKVSDEEAFQILRSASSRTNTKLAALADKINESHRENLA